MIKCVHLYISIYIQLLDRSGYRPVLTKAGMICYEKVKELKKQYDELLDYINKTCRQNIKMAFTGSFENRHVLQAIYSIEKDSLDIHLSFLKCNFDASLRKLLDGEVDQLKSYKQLCVGLFKEHKDEMLLQFIYILQTYFATL